MIPKSRTDRLFGRGSSGQDEDVDIEVLDSTSHNEVSPAAKLRTSSTKKVKPQSKERSHQGSTSLPSICSVLGQVGKRELVAYKAEQESEDSEEG